MKTFMLIAALAAGGGSALASITFYTIGPDNQFVPSAFTSILLPGGPVTNLFDLGGGVKGFNGGITYDPLNNSFYGIGNDDQGNSSLQIFTAGGNGTILTVESLGTGFTSGLTFDSTDGNLYAISNDFQVTGHSFLNRISLSDMSVIPIVDLGLGFEGGGLFTGGLTYNPNDGLFYVLSADANGVSQAVQFHHPVGSIGNGDLPVQPGHRRRFLQRRPGVQSRGQPVLRNFQRQLRQLDLEILRARRRHHHLRTRSRPGIQQCGPDPGAIGLGA